jgi:hypothetical protein
MNGPGTACAERVLPRRAAPRSSPPPPGVGSPGSLRGAPRPPRHPFDFRMSESFTNGPG